jgi:hypothetical protein
MSTGTVMAVAGALLGGAALLSRHRGVPKVRERRAGMTR